MVEARRGGRSTFSASGGYALKLWRHVNQQDMARLSGIVAPEAQAPWGQLINGLAGISSDATSSFMLLHLMTWHSPKAFDIEGAIWA